MAGHVQRRLLQQGRGAELLTQARAGFYGPGLLPRALPVFVAANDPHAAEVVRLGAVLQLSKATGGNDQVDVNTSNIDTMILLSGLLADEFRSAVQHVVGHQEAVVAVCIGPNDDMEARRKDIADGGDGVGRADLLHVQQHVGLVHRSRGQRVGQPRQRAQRGDAQDQPAPGHQGLEVRAPRQRAGVRLGQRFDPLDQLGRRGDAGLVCSLKE